MKNIIFNEIIAERELELRTRKGELKKVVVQIGKPMPMTVPNPNDNWYCPFKISGLKEKDTIRAAGGVD